MPTIITNREHYLDYFNGPNFDLNTSDVATHLHGTVGNYTKVLYEIRVEYNTKSSISSTFTVSGDLITRSSGSFREDEFAIGDIVDLYAYDDQNGVPLQWSEFDIVITALDDDFIIVSGLSTDRSGVYGSGDTDIDGKFRLEMLGFSPLTSMFRKHGFVGNDDNTNFNSPLDNTEMGYFAIDIGLDIGGGVRDTNWVEAGFLGNFRSSQTGSVRVRYVDNPTRYRQVFEVEHIFKIIPNYLEGQDENIEDNDPPEPFDGQSLKYVTQHEFRIVANDANTSKTVLDENQIGAVGWYGQNYNLQPNNFSVSNVSYEDLSSNPVDSLLASAITKVSFRVTSSVSSFVNGSSIIQLNTSFLPESSEYSKKEELYSEIWEDESFRDTLGNTTITGQPIIQNISSTFVDANTIDVEADILYQNKTADDNYIISINIATDGIESGNSDLVNEIVDFNTFVKSANIEGLCFLNSMFIADYENDDINQYGGYIEDNIRLDWEIEIEHDRNAQLESSGVMIMAFNPITGERFAVLDEPVPFEVIANKTDTYEYQEITTDQNVGYKLSESDTFGKRTINTGALVGTRRIYSGSYGVKIPWQSWQQLVGADEEFTDVTQPFNGLNKDSSRYNNINDYELRAVVYFDVSGNDEFGNSGLTRYHFSKEEMNIGGYDDDPAYEVEFETFNDLNNDNVTGAFLSNEDTRVEATVISGLPSNAYGIMRFEPSNSQTDRDIYEHNESTIKSNYLDNAFSGVLVKNFSGGTLTFQGVVKKEYVNNGVGYKPSLMVKCPSAQSFSIFTDITSSLNNFIGQVNSPLPVTYIFEDNSTFVGTPPTNAINTSGNGLNGTIQEVRIQCDDLNSITLVQFNNVQIVQNVDISQLPLVETVEFTGNSIDGITFADNAPISDLNLSNNSGAMTTVDLSNTNLSGVVDLQADLAGTYTKLTSVLLPTNNNVFTSVNMADNALTTLDASGLSGFSQIVLLQRNNLTSIQLHPNATVSPTNFNVSFNALLDLDLSGYPSMSGNIFIQNNGMITFTQPQDSGTIGNFWFNDNSIVLMDLSNMSGGIGNLVQGQRNSLTSITFPNSTAPTSNMSLAQQTGGGPLTFDFSPLLGLRGSLQIQTNSNTENVIFGNTTAAMTLFRATNCNLGYVDFTPLFNSSGITIELQNNSMVASEVNHIYVDLDSTGWTGGLSNTSGNAAPDGVSGGYDGLTAISNLFNKFWFVIT